MATWDGNWTGVASYSISGIGAVVEEVAQVLQSDVATSNGVWFSCAGVISVSFDIQGITTGTVTIRGSNEATVPAATEHERVVGTDATADGFKSFEGKEIPRWMKARTSAWTTGTFIVWAKRVRRSG